MGDPPEMASEWHRFCQRKGKDSEFPCILLPPCLLSTLSLSINFLDDPYSTFHIHMISRKGSEVPFGPGLSPIFKSLKDQKLPYHSKESLSKEAYLTGGEGTKLPPLLNILKNSLLTTPLSQGWEGPSFPHSCKFP